MIKKHSRRQKSLMLHSQQESKNNVTPIGILKVFSVVFTFYLREWRYDDIDRYMVGDTYPCKSQIHRPILSIKNIYYFLA